MKVAIDRLGRIVIPKSVRERYHLVPGTDLELDVDVNGFHLKPAHDDPVLIRKEGVLVHHGTDTVDIDIAARVTIDRDRRVGELVAEEPGE
ncbi:MAG: AbrB/MazE/SpoVT family DNA-binding domain-containing protein [Spirochaetaceae bacterium]|nr:MAG: AbrB/MazE/SpoVT family DNA-binding domain-containing protein [Spirochaetaceae bacterium]